METLYLSERVTEETVVVNTTLSGDVSFDFGEYECIIKREDLRDLRHFLDIAIEHWKKEGIEK